MKPYVTIAYIVAMFILFGDEMKKGADSVLYDQSQDNPGIATVMSLKTSFHGSKNTFL